MSLGAQASNSSNKNPSNLSTLDNVPTTKCGDDTISWQMLFWALIALAITSMSQPSYIDRYIRESLLYFARSSPYVCIAEALDLMLREGVYRSLKLPLRDSIVMARERFDHKPGDKAEDDIGRSILWTWLLFFMAALTPAGKLFAMHGIPGTKATACLYLIGIVIRAAIDVVPRRKKEIKATPDEFGLSVSHNSLASRRDQIVERMNYVLEGCSHILQCLGFAATLAIMLWISFTLLMLVTQYMFPKPVHFGSIHHFGTYLKRLVGDLLQLSLHLVLVILACLFAAVVVMGCYFGVGCIATILGLESLEFEKPNMRRIMLYTFALLLMLTALAFYAHLYDRSGTSRAGVPEALG